MASVPVLSRIVLPKYLKGTGGSTSTNIFDVLMMLFFAAESVHWKVVIISILKQPLSETTYGDPRRTHSFDRMVTTSSLCSTLQNS